MEWQRTLFGGWAGAQMARRRRIPRFDKVLRDFGLYDRPRQRTPTQLMAIAEQLNALFGGADKRRRKDTITWRR